MYTFDQVSTVGTVSPRPRIHGLSRNQWLKWEWLLSLLYQITHLQNFYTYTYNFRFYCLVVLVSKRVTPSTIVTWNWSLRLLLGHSEFLTPLNRQRKGLLSWVIAPDYQGKLSWCQDTWTGKTGGFSVMTLVAIISNDKSELKTTSINKGKSHRSFRLS